MKKGKSTKEPKEPKEKKVAKRKKAQVKEILYGPRLSQLKGLNNQLAQLRANYGAMKMANNPYSPFNTQYAFPQYNPLRQEQQISLIRAQTANALDRAETIFNKRLAETQSQFMNRLEETQKLKARGLDEPLESESQLYKDVSVLDPEMAEARREGESLAKLLGGKLTKSKSYKNEYGGFFFTDAMVKKSPQLTSIFKKPSQPSIAEEQGYLSPEE